MKFIKLFSGILAILVIFSACENKEKAENTTSIKIVLSDEIITVDGKNIESVGDVYLKNDIIYYESGKDFTYGEGSEKDAHTKEEADEHKVIHINKAGTYEISGKLSKGQIAVDLGEDAENDVNAKVTLILNNIDITCQVAPAIIFYNVYECGDKDNPTKDVDTSNSGAKVIIAENSVNTVDGSYVEKIYKPETVVLNEDKTEVEDAKKLHKYDGAFYSKMSMELSGEGTLNIYAQNEGLDSEMHLTIKNGNINIVSGNDGINTNEDGVSVTTISGGNLNITVNGKTGEGDGIDSNGWLVINGGTVISKACSTNGDSGIDSDMGIHITGGTVIATGSMLDRIEECAQNYAVFNFTQTQRGKTGFEIKDSQGNAVMDEFFENDFTILVFSSPELRAGTYTLWGIDTQLSVYSGGMMGGFKPDGERHEIPENFEPNGERPEIPEGMMPGGERPEKPEGMMPDSERPEEFKPETGIEPPNPEGNFTGEATKEFKITDGANNFNVIIE